MKEHGLTLCYEIDPNLNPSLPDSNTKTDMFHNVPNDYTMCQLELG